MCKLLNRIFYGNTNDEPKFIHSKNKWLYQNKWVDNDTAYWNLAEKNVSYTYELTEGHTSSYGEVYSFDAVVDMVQKYGNRVNFNDLGQFSVQQINVIISIKQAQSAKEQKEIEKKLKELDKCLKEIGFNEKK